MESLATRLAVLREAEEAKRPLELEGTEELFLSFYKWYILHPDFSVLDFRLLIHGFCSSLNRSNGTFFPDCEPALISLYSKYKLPVAGVQYHNRYQVMSEISLFVPAHLQVTLAKWTSDLSNCLTPHD